MSASATTINKIQLDENASPSKHNTCSFSIFRVKENKKNDLNINDIVWMLNPTLISTITVYS